MDLAGIKAYLEDDSLEARQLGDQLVKQIATKLDKDESTVRMLIDTVDEDPQVTFVWHLWNEAFPEK